MGIGGGSVLVPWRPAFWIAAEVVRKIKAQEASGGGGFRRGGRVSVVANPKTDSMRTKVSAAAAAAAAVSVGSSFAACGKKNFGPFFARRARKNGERGAFLSRNGNFKNFGPFF